MTVYRQKDFKGRITGEPRKGYDGNTDGDMSLCEGNDCLDQIKAYDEAWRGKWRTEKKNRRVFVKSTNHDKFFPHGWNLEGDGFIMSLKNDPNTYEFSNGYEAAAFFQGVVFADTAELVGKKCKELRVLKTKDKYDQKLFVVKMKKSPGKFVEINEFHGKYEAKMFCAGVFAGRGNSK